MKKILILLLFILPIINKSQTCTLTVSKNPACIGDTVWLYASTSFSNSNFSWTGPNGFTGSNDTVKVVLSSTSYSGIYQCTAGSGTVSICSTTLNLVVNPFPSVNILSSSNTGCVPLTTTFNCISFPTASSVNWQFGNSLTSTVQIATTTFTNAGTFTTTANVTDINGCKGFSTYTTQVYPNPIADFTFTIGTGGNVSFTDQSVGSINNWNWSFTSPNQSNSQNPSYTFTNTSQNYTVCLIVKTSNSCSDTICKTVQFSGSIGIKEIAFSSGIKVYPNPAKEKIIITGTSDNFDFVLYDQMGNLLLKQKMNPNKAELNITEMKSGFYFIRIIQNGNTIFADKIIKD